jgi:hypothetical protein
VKSSVKTAHYHTVVGDDKLRFQSPIGGGADLNGSGCPR